MIGNFCFCFSIHFPLSMRYKINIHAYSHIYFIRSISHRCDDVFHHFIVLTNSKFTLRCAYLSRFVRSRFTHISMCVCVWVSVYNLICFVYAFPKMRWSIFVMPPPFRLVAQRVRKRIWCPGTGCYGTRCYVHVASASVANSSSMCFICGHTELMWVCASVCTRILASEPEIERSENKLGIDDSLFNSTARDWMR